MDRSPQPSLHRRTPRCPSHPPCGLQPGLFGQEPVPHIRSIHVRGCDPSHRLDFQRRLRRARQRARPPPRLPRLQPARRPRRRRGPFSRRVALPRRHHLSSRFRKLIANSSTAKSAAMRPFTSGLAGANHPRTFSLHQKIPPPSRLARCAPRVLIASRIAMKPEIRWLAHPALAR